MDLDDCYKKGLIKKTRVNTSLIKSLIEMSDVNENTVKEAAITETNVPSYVVLAYESLREVLEAMCISKGYKVLSHVCLGELLKTLVSDFNYEGFDRLRYVRNGINYYGTKVDLEQGKELIKKTFSMKHALLSGYLKEFA